MDKDGVKRVIVARERGGLDKGTFDDFGGKAERYDAHPLVSASREFQEEAIVEQTIGLNKSDVNDYVEDNATLVIAYYLQKHDTYGITYIIDFTKDAEQLLTNFYCARKKATAGKYKEKDRIATITWDALMETISKSQKGQDVTIMAKVIDPKTLDGDEELITLRPIFVNKLKLYSQHKPYKKGKADKVRFYSWAYADVVCDNGN